jgi:hypothetical protein
MWDSCSCLLTQQRLWCLDDTQLYSAELMATPTFQSISLQTLLQASISTQMVLAPSADQQEVWLGHGHTYWLLTMQGGEVSTSSQLDGVPLVGSCDVTSTQDGQECDVRVERRPDTPTDTLSVSYQVNGKVTVAKPYTFDVDRGTPIMVSGRVSL